MVIGPIQCFVLFIVLFAAIGARRGWNREVIACAFILGTVMFLSLGGLNLIDQLLSNGLISTASAKGLMPSGGIPPSGSGVGAGALAATPAPASDATASCPPLVKSPILSSLIFGGMSWLGYRVSAKYGQPPKSSNHRIAGIMPGAINGAAIAYYVSSAILPGQVTVQTPTSATTANFLPLVFGVGLIGLLLVVFIASQASKSAK